MPPKGKAQSSTNLTQSRDAAEPEVGSKDYIINT